MCHSSLRGMGDRRGPRRDLRDEEEDVDRGEVIKLDVVEHAEGALDDLCSDSSIAVVILKWFC